MTQLVRRCLSRDSAEAWGQFWLFFDEVAANPVRRLLMRRGFTAEDAEDVVMEAFVSLFVDGEKKLASFAGESVDKLAAWCVSVACNAARDWVRRQRKVRGVNAEILLASLPADHSLDEARTRFLLSQLESIALAGDVDRLRMLAGLNPMPDSVSPRTVRYWKKSLQAKYADFFRDGLAD